MSERNVKEHFYRTRFTFYGPVLLFEYALDTEGRHAGTTFFLRDGSDDAFVSVLCNSKDEHGHWRADYSMTNMQVKAGCVSEFVSSCKEFCDCYFDNRELFDNDEAMLAASVIEPCHEH